MSTPFSRRVGRGAAALALVTGAIAVGVASASTAGALDGMHTFKGHKIVHPTRDSNRSPMPATSRGSGSLKYGGAVDGIGVTTGKPQVYLVFWGSGWGTPGTNANNDTTLSGDTVGMAPVLQEFLKGLGTNNEKWSNVMAQYCEGIAAGTATCTSANPSVGYPTGGALAGVWVDPSTTAITSSGSTANSPVDHDIAAEAILAASHFGNTTGAANRSAQYVIVSPTGTHPGGFNAPLNWCAWHDWNGDTTLVGGAATSTVGDIAFTNLPYLTDVGASCGADYVNGTSGALDGVTIVEGHEYAETITDQNPAGGWTDAVGYENGDKCAWVGTGGTGGAQNIALATGSFPVQATWSNQGSACLVALTPPAPGVVNGGFESSFTGWSRGGTTSIVTSPVHSGTRAALAGSTSSRTNGDSSVTQTFTAAGSTLSFWYRTRCAENVGVDWATATLVDNNTATTSTPLARTCTNNGTWVQVSVAVTAGHSYTLKLTNHDNNNRASGTNTYTYFDDIVG